MARDPYKYFRIEARDLAEQLGHSLLELERTGSGGEVVPRLLRLAHTLKGAARVVRLGEIADQAHRIEDLLTPYRETTQPVPAGDIELLLKLLDAIAARVAGLTQPEATEAPVAAAPAAEQQVGLVRSDVSEIDELLDGVTEANAQLGGLREVAGAAARAKRLSDQMFEQLSLAAIAEAGPGALRDALASAELLRAAAANVERGIAATHQRVERELRDLHDTAEQLRLVPAAALFPNLERAARNSAQVLGKEIAFSGEGGDIRLDAQIVRRVQDALLQLIRNAVAHGIEVARDRIGRGKPAQGRVAITVLRRGRRVVFRCEDDGRGIDVAALRDAALRKGRPAPEPDKNNRNELVQLLLQGGLSTSPFVSEVAGRGIGMDIVRETVTVLAGDLAIDTTPGKGTRFELSVPLSVASVESLLLEAPGVTATLPLQAVRHTVRLQPSDIHRTSLGETIIHEGQPVPLVPLAGLLGRPATARRSGSQSAVIVGAAGGLAAIGVSRLPGTSSIVFRSLPDLAPSTAVIAGASLDADGTPLLMLDADGIVAMAQRHTSVAEVAGAPRKPLLVIDNSLTTRMLEQSILELAGYEVDVATSAEEGLERVRLRDYGLILVDVEMPGMDGFTFIEHLRRDPHLRDIPAILVTSRNAPADRRRGQDVGAQGYVVKSEFDQAGLLDDIERLVV